MSLALPVKDGVASLERATGWFSVTAGAVVSTANVTGTLVPGGFPSELSWLAIAVYSCFPLDSAGVASPDVQLPPWTVAVALETSEPPT